MKVAVCDEQPEMLHILSDILSELPIVKKVELAMCGGYDFIEVYVDCCRAISSTGAVSVVSC